MAVPKATEVVLPDRIGHVELVERVPDELVRQALLR